MKKLIILLFLAFLSSCKKQSCKKIKLFSPIENIEIGDFEENVIKELKKYKDLNILGYDWITKSYNITIEGVEVEFWLRYCDEYYDECPRTDTEISQLEVNNSVLVALKLRSENNKRVMKYLKENIKNSSDLYIKEHLIKDTFLGMPPNPYILIYSNKASYSKGIYAFGCKDIRIAK